MFAMTLLLGGGGGNGNGNVEAPPDVYGRFGVTSPVCQRDMRRVPRLVDLACAALAEAFSTTAQV